MSTTQVKSEEDQNMADTDSGVESTASASTSTTSIDQVMDPEIQRKRKVFYDTYANAAFHLSDGTTLKVSSAYLATENHAFNQLFLSSAPENIVYIQDYDFNTFRLFLDCLMGFQECTGIDALLIFPIARKYEAEKLIKKCIDVLKPTELNENVCLTLNMALFYQCKELIDALYYFLYERLDEFYGDRLIDDETYFLLLEPEAVRQLLGWSKINMDSHRLKNIFIWAYSYLRRKQKTSTEIKSFLIEHDIIRYVTLKAFETTSSISEFNESELGNGFFSPEECWAHVKTYGWENGKSEWFKIKSGDVLIENFLIKNIVLAPYSVTEIILFSNKRMRYDFNNDNFEVAVTLNCGLLNKILKAGNTRRFLGCCFGFTILWDENICFASTLKIELKFRFKGDGRILKRSPEKNLLIERNSEDLYFIRNVEINQKEQTNIFTKQKTQF